MKNTKDSVRLTIIKEYCSFHLAENNIFKDR